MSQLDLKTAQRLASTALATAEKLFQRPVCAAVCDASGFLLAFLRGDGTPIRSIEISQGKAYTAARMGKTTTAFHQQLQQEQVQARDFCDPRLTALSGGAVLQDAAGAVLGSIGISGLKAHEDQTVADAVAKSFTSA
jgi:glc operon protein GlcG